MARTSKGGLGVYSVWQTGLRAGARRHLPTAFEKILGGRGGYNRWTINDKSWPNTIPLFTVEQGKRYRLVMNNNSGDPHPVLLHRHTF